MNTLQDRFLKKVDMGSECWNWKAHLNNMGYGMMSVRHMNSQLAHRISYLLFVGPIPIGQCVLHKCDNPKCVRPDHLFLGTMKDNTQDMLRKKRNNPPVWIGRVHPRAKLKMDQVQDIRKVLSNKTTLEQKKQVAHQYGVHVDTIYNILSNRCWNKGRTRELVHPITQPKP